MMVMIPWGVVEDTPRRRIITGIRPRHQITKGNIHQITKGNIHLIRARWRITMIRIAKFQDTIYLILHLPITHRFHHINLSTTTHHPRHINPGPSNMQSPRHINPGRGNWGFKSLCNSSKNTNPGRVNWGFNSLCSKNINPGIVNWGFNSICNSSKRMAKKIPQERTVRMMSNILFTTLMLDLTE